MNDDRSSQQAAAEEIRVRAASSCDAVVVASLIRRAFADQPVKLAPPPSALRETAGRIASHFDKGGGFIGEASGIVVAACLWSKADQTMWLSRLAVDPPWRRRGFALLLLRHAEQAARAQGLQRVMLSTRLALAGNRRLFEQAGYKETTLRRHAGFDAPTYVEMELRLA